ncbi:unnamed protein product [Heterobilharzia americana]|nr:unnamed protein product [Heterobilharzia americana]
MGSEQQLIVPDFSLIKYKPPVRITDKTDLQKYSQNNEEIFILKKSRSQSVGPSATGSRTGFPTSFLTLDPNAARTVGSTEDILRSIIPPRRFITGNSLYIQEASSCPATRTDVIQLIQQLDQQLELRGAKMTGICPVRRELFIQVFDELIRQLTIHCAERGLLLLRVRNEVATTLAALQSIYASGVVFGLQKSLARAADHKRQISQISTLEKEITSLRKQIQKEALNCQAVEEKEANRLAAAIEELKKTKNFLKKVVIS